MNLTQLSKDDKIKELIKDVKSKNSLRMKFSFEVSILSDQELEDFFEQIHERIDHISDAPTFQFSEVVNNKLIQKSVQTQTLKFQDLQTCIAEIRIYRIEYNLLLRHTKGKRRVYKFQVRQCVR